MTVPYDPSILRKKNLELAALYIACGIDPDLSTIFIQSENPDHPYTAWIFDCITPFGWMNRMTQFKDKSKKQKENTTVGLFNYPALMAADILLYDTDLVPVGDDQIQHIELARDIARRFNNLFGQTFAYPEAMVDKKAARIKSLQDPRKKMSKSDNNEKSRINILDTEEKILEKIQKAVTDSGAEIIYDPEKKPAISNLLSIYSKLTNKTISEIENIYQGKTYSKFKSDLAEVIIEFLKPIQKKFYELQKEKTELNKILDKGLQKAREISSKKLSEIKRKVGLVR